jgi:hypothetical protein
VVFERKKKLYNNHTGINVNFILNNRCPIPRNKKNQKMKEEEERKF